MWIGSELESRKVNGSTKYLPSFRLGCIDGAERSISLTFNLAAQTAIENAVASDIANGTTNFKTGETIPTALQQDVDNKKA